jgi:hypothetical protein
MGLFVFRFYPPEKIIIKCIVIKNESKYVIFLIRIFLMSVITHDTLK